MNTQDKIERLTEIKVEIRDLLQECKRLLRDEGMTWQRAEPYWWATARPALDGESGYCSGPMTTMQDTIDELIESLVDTACDQCGKPAPFCRCDPENS
jgi:hypothetical protein